MSLLNDLVQHSTELSPRYKTFLSQLPEEDAPLCEPAKERLRKGRLGIQGGRGSFNEQAARLLLKREHLESAQINYCFTTQGVLEALEEETISIGQFAVFNSIGGAVEETEKVVEDYRLVFHSLHAIPIQHFLMTPKSLKCSEIETIMAHSQVLRQCAENLQKLYPDCAVKSGEGELYDTARLAQAIAENDPRVPERVAVLGPKILSELFHFECSECSLEDSPDNRTWFVLVSLLSND